MDLALAKAKIASFLDKAFKMFLSFLAEAGITSKFSASVWFGFTIRFALVYKYRL
jgi:hypothetical protein